jgi:hypothetical protein
MRSFLFEELGIRIIAIVLNNVDDAVVTETTVE